MVKSFEFQADYKYQELKEETYKLSGAKLTL